MSNSGNKASSVKVSGSATHAVIPPSANGAGHIHWGVVRANDGVELERCADYATAVARAQVLSAQAIKLGLPV